MLSISSVLGFQDGYKMNGSEQRQIQNGVSDAKLFLLLQLIYGPKLGISGFQQKQLLHTCYDKNCDTYFI
jgi:hypothetical protein